MSDKPEHQEIAQLKEYIDNRIEKLRGQQTEQYLGALQSAGLDREQIEERAGALMSHGMTRRAALGAIVASIFGAGVLVGSEQAEAATATGYVKTGELRDGNNSTQAILNNGGPFALQVPLSAQEAEITNETFVKGNLNSAKDINAGTSVNIFDTEDSDNRGELNSSYQFVPDKSGLYSFSFNIKFTNATDQDIIRARLVNQSTSSFLANVDGLVNGIQGTISSTLIGDLTAGDTYEIRAQNFNSDCSLAATGTNGTIYRLPIQE